MSESTQKSLFSPEAPQPELRPWERAAEADRLVAGVVFNRPLETVYHYLVPDGLRGLLAPGQRVKAPFGRGDRATVGFCVEMGPPPESVDKLKPIDSVIDSEPLLSPNMLELTRWIAEYYLCAWGQVLHSVVPAGVKKRAGTRLVTFFEPTRQARDRRNELNLPAKQEAVLNVLCGLDEPLRIEDLTDAAGCGTGPVKSLRDKGLIRSIRRRTGHFEADAAPVERIDDLTLNDDQQRALDTLLSLLRSGVHETVLLHGVTGSGKTEVYIQAIREVVSYGRQAIVLVPEISLTPQTIRRFRSRFDSVAVLHSHLSDAERHWQWEQIARGSVQVVVGARSAVFAPTPNLGLIVIDEEHETTFKQQTVPRYHARDIARQRARLEGVPLVLGSATPSLENWLDVERGRATLISLPKRVERLPLPPVVIVDVRNDPYCKRGAAIGRALESAMRHTLEDGGQVILLLNLRGFSPAVWCRLCGETVKCPDCDVTLTWHKDQSVTLCHSCDFRSQPPSHCPSCGQAGMRYVGVGTQKLEQEVRGRFSRYRCLRMDSDSMRKHGSHDEALEAFRRGEVQILLGTQMIAKGLDFPNVTLVGVVAADALLHQPDIRSAERTFQLISQVAGRTGRSARGGRVFVQTASPAEPAVLMAADHDYQGFAKRELEHRHEMLAPPYYRLTRVVFRGINEAAVKTQAAAVSVLLREAAKSGESDVRILGPAPAPIAKLKKNYRYHVQLAATQLAPIQELWHQIAGDIPRTSGVEHIVDVDPLDMR